LYRYTVASLQKEMEDQDAKWEQRVDGVSKMAKCRDICLLMEKCRAALAIWSRRARRTPCRHVVGSCVPEERPNHPKGDAFKARVQRQKFRWSVGGLEYVEARWEMPRVLDPRKRIVHNAATSGRRWLMFSRWRRVTFYRHLQTITAAEVFGKVAVKIISKRWLAWATAARATRRAEEGARRAAAAKEAEEYAKKAQAMGLLAGNHNRRSVLLSHFQRWRHFLREIKQEVLTKLKRVVARMQLFHASAAIHKWAEGIMVSRGELAAQRGKLWAMRMGHVVLAWRVWARRSADPLLRAAYGMWHQVLQTGAGQQLQPWISPLDVTRLMMLERVKGPNSVWRGSLWEKVVPGVHPAIRELVMTALEAAVRRRPIWQHFRAWREWTHDVFSKTRGYQLWFRRTLPCRRALTTWIEALAARHEIEASAARQFPLYRQRRVLQTWWLAAAEAVSRGPQGGNTATAAAIREDAGPAESAAAWIAWESRGRPLQHWLGRALTIAANVPWHRSALANKEGGPGATAAQVIDARTAEATKSLIERTLKAGRNLNRDRDAHHGGGCTS
jgi:hypothetical protein